jgi:hypothetical protein
MSSPAPPSTPPSSASSSRAAAARLCRRTLVACLVALAASACAAPDADEATGAEESEQRVKPQGALGLATVTVNVPPSFAMSATIGGATYGYELSFNGTSVEPGKPTRVAPTTTPGNWGCLRIRLSSKAGSTVQEECIFQLAPNKALTIQLGTAKLWWAGYPRVHADFLLGEPGRNRIARTWQDKTYPLRDAGLVANDLPILLVPGSYVYGVENAAFPLKPFTVQAGRQTDVNVDYNALLARLRLDVEAAELPDVSPISMWMNVDFKPSLRCADAAGSTKTFPIATRSASRELQVLLDRPSTTCDLSFAFASPFSVPVTLAGGQLTAQAIGRIDVDDVTLTDEGNRVVPGTWNIRRREGANWGPMLLGPDGAPTSRGVHVPSGKYEVVVTYRTASGEKTTTTHVVVVP